MVEKKFRFSIKQLKLPIFEQPIFEQFKVPIFAQIIFEKFRVLIADQTLLGPMFEQI
jgi:hypothetical protein